MHIDLSDRVALVTGAGSGLGAACARALANAGAVVLLADIDADKAAQVTASIGASASAKRLDVCSEQDWQALIADIAAEHARLDILVHSAGVLHMGNLSKTSYADWKRVQTVNVDGIFLGCREALPLMERDHGGAIVNICSVSGNIAGHNIAAYNASKGAVRMLTKSIALQCARSARGVRCNSVHPTFVDTPMVRGLSGDDASHAEMLEKMRRQIPLGRLASPNDIASAVVFLASDQAAFITAAELMVDGGMTAQ